MKRESEIQQLINSSADPKDYLIKIFKAKYEDREPWAQKVKVDQIAYYAAIGDFEKVRKLVEQNNRKAKDRIEPKKEKQTEAAPTLQYKDDEPGF